MSVNKVDSNGQLVTIASNSRVWIGTKAAYEAAEANGEIPNNCTIYVTDDYQDKDVDKTNFTLHFRLGSNGKECIVIDSVERCFYKVHNGICTVNFQGAIHYDSSIDTTGGIAINYGENPDLPKPGSAAVGGWWSSTLDDGVGVLIDDTDIWSGLWFKWSKATGDAKELNTSHITSSTKMKLVFTYAIA